MSKTQRPPLTPADSNYLGMGHDGLHALRWGSQSRSGLTHTTTGTAREARSCSCEAFQWSLVGDGAVGCKHTRCWADALRHHLDPPPADLGGAGLDAAQAGVDDETDDWILGGKLSPPPRLVAPSGRRRRHDDGMAALYGDDWRTI